MSTHTRKFACQLPHHQADTLNRESGRIYSVVVVEHYRIYRKKGIWLHQYNAQKLNDYYDAEQPKLLHSHSIDAAQQAFYKACKQVYTRRQQRDEKVQFLYKRRRYRTTIWKNTGVYRVENGIMVLSLAQGLERLVMPLPSHLSGLKKEQIQEVRLVFNKATFRYAWHVVFDDGIEPPEPSAGHTAGGDLGEVHPIALTDGEAACVVSCRELRAVKQGRNRDIASIDAKLATYQKGSRRWKKLKARKRRLLAQSEQKQRDMEHKIARSVVNWAQERNIGLLVLGDVRDIADGKRLNKKSQQKIANWSHGCMRKYIGYKAREVGIQVKDDIPEPYTSQTCPACGHRHKPKGRIYRCTNPDCRQVFHRDVVGAANILSRHKHGELAKIPAPKPKYRHPVVVRGKRSPSGTGQERSPSLEARFGESRQRWR